MAAGRPGQTRLGRCSRRERRLDMEAIAVSVADMLASPVFLDDLIWEWNHEAEQAEQDRQAA